MNNAQSTPAWGRFAPIEALTRGFEFAAEPEGTLAGEAAERRAAGIEFRQGFRIGTLGLMVPYAAGSELTELPAVHRLPHAPAWFAGICNLHGALVPVFDLARRFGIERDPRAKPMLLVLGHGADAAGVLVEGLPQRLRFGAGELADSATVPAGLAHLVTQAALIGERLWLDLAVPALLSSLAEPLAAPHS